jgi:hypothetical protein
LSKSVIYKATVKCENADKSYIGLTGNTFKERYNNHTKSFKHKKYEKETELSKYIWTLKRKHKNYTIKWDIIKKTNTGKRKSGQCNLCLEEKLQILKNNNIINKRSELISKCRHNNRRKPKQSLSINPHDAIRVDGVG